MLILEKSWSFLRPCSLSWCLQKVRNQFPNQLQSKSDKYIVQFEQIYLIWTNCQQSPSFLWPAVCASVCRNQFAHQLQLGGWMKSKNAKVRKCKLCTSDQFQHQLQSEGVEGGWSEMAPTRNHIFGCIRVVYCGQSKEVRHRHYEWCHGILALLQRDQKELPFSTLHCLNLAITFLHVLSRVL